MIFADAPLARRIEGVEASQVAAFAEAVRSVRPNADAHVAQVGGGVAAITEPGSPYNKLAGLGFAELDEDALDLIEAELAARGIAPQAEVSALADASVLRTLTRRGYVLRGFENVLGLELDRRFSAPAPPAGLRIEPVAARSSTAWVSALADGFIAPSDPSGPEPHESLGREALERVFEDAGHVAGLERHLALRDGTTAGGASMRIADGVAQLCGAATRPEHRRRGVQTALVQHRLAIAARRGCDLAIVTTQPGSESQRNLQRHGFALLYARAILVLPR